MATPAASLAWGSPPTSTGSSPLGTSGGTSGDPVDFGPPPDAPPSFGRQRSRSMSPSDERRGAGAGASGGGGYDDKRPSTAWVGDVRGTLRGGGGTFDVGDDGDDSDYDGAAAGAGAAASAAGAGAAGGDPSHNRSRTPPPDLRGRADGGYAAGVGRPKRADRVQVIARFRPPSNIELRKGGSDIVAFDADGMGVVQTPDDGVPHQFRFSRVLSPEMSQDDVYHFAGKPLVSAVLGGFNACVMCYGQTGSGKTFTMMGPPVPGRKGRFLVHGEERGIIPRMMGDVFTHLGLLDPDSYFYEVRCSYIEIYMEVLRDLLMPERRPLTLREDALTGVTYTDGTEVPCETPADVVRLLEQGALNRATAATAANPDSSRSHAVFTATVFVRDLARGTMRSSQLYLVDLAGSERQDKTGATGSTLREASMINRSLLSLGNVIVALTTPRRGRGAAFIPYRDSKLTYLLKNSFGGNSRTTLIINASPHSYNASETLSTLRFGDRASTVANKPVANERKSVAELRKQLDAANRSIYEQTLRMRLLNQTLARMRRVAETTLARLPPDSPQLKSLLLQFPMLRDVASNKHRVMRKLPRMALGLMFTYLDGAAITRCAGVCKQWRTLSASERLWKEIFTYEFGELASADAAEASDGGGSGDFSSGGAVAHPIGTGDGPGVVAGGDESGAGDGAAPEVKLVNGKLPAGVTYRSLYVDKASAAYRLMLEKRKERFEANRREKGFTGIGLRLMPAV